MKIKAIILGILLILNSYGQLFAADSAAILMYHRFDENKYPSTNIRKEQFIQQLDYLEKNQFHIWPLHQVVHFLKQKKALPPKVVAITIDDAYASVYEVAFPILKERNIPFTLFVATKPIAGEYKNYMTWDNLREMAESGVELGNHTRGHLHLVEKKENEAHEEWLARIEEEILSARHQIKEKTGAETLFFAYPYGEFNLELSELIKSLGYVGFGQHSGAAGYSDDVGYLPRFPVSEQFADMNEFATKVSSIAMPIEAVWPEEVVVKSAMPMLRVKLSRQLSNKGNLRCYVSGQGEGVVSWRSDSEFVVKANAPLMQRRSRYNCTLRESKSGQFYWYSHLWVRTAFPEP